MHAQVYARQQSLTEQFDQPKPEQVSNSRGQLTNMSLGTAQHDPLQEAAQGQTALRVGAAQGPLQQCPPGGIMVEGLIGQKLQQALHDEGLSETDCQQSKCHSSVRNEINAWWPYGTVSNKICWCA